MIKLSSLFAALTLLALAPAHAEDMSFRTVALGAHCGERCPQVVSAQGEIVESTPDAFLQFVHQHVRGGNLHGVVLLDSPGGKVVASMELGRTLRRLGMAVIVARTASEGERSEDLLAAKCYSACVYALMGGRKRVIPPQSRVGVHRMFNYSTSFNLFEGGLVRERNYDDGDMRAVLTRYSNMMGISTALINLAEQTSPDRIHVLTGAEITRWRLGSRKL
jgi:hypothetical protein